MTEDNSPFSELKAECSKVANRFLENYFGEERPTTLPFGWRVICALAGALTPLSFAVKSDKIGVVAFLSDVDEVAIIKNVALIVIQASPFVLALMIAYSIKTGGPLRFFLVGFFLYSLMYSVVF